MILIGALTPFFLAQSLSAREWVDVSGKYRVEAEFVKADKEQVTLKRRDGSTVQVPLARLSRPDRLHVAKLLRDTANKAGGKPQPLMLDEPAFLTNEKGMPSFSIIAKVTASNSAPIQEHSLLPVMVMFNESVEGELIDLKSDPKSLVKTDDAIITADSNPDDVIFHYSWTVASKQSRVRGKALGAVANYQPGSAETILYVKNDAASLKSEFGKTPADGGTWGLFLADRKFRRISNVLVFSNDDLVKVDRTIMVYVDRMKSLVDQPAQQ
jgi:hypothetical protein